TAPGAGAAGVNGAVWLDAADLGVNQVRQAFLHVRDCATESGDDLCLCFLERLDVGCRRGGAGTLFDLGVHDGVRAVVVVVSTVGVEQNEERVLDVRVVQVPATDEQLEVFRVEARGPRL